MAAGERAGGSDRRLLILTDDFRGGTGNHLLSVAERCAGAGWRVEVASFQPRRTRRDPEAMELTRLPSPSGPSVYPLHQVARLRQVARLVRDRSPDVLHVYFFWPILYGRLLKAAGAVSCLIENREDEGFNWGAHEYVWLRLTRRLPDQVVCVSEAIRRLVIDREKLEPAQATVIHNGIAEPDPVDPSSVGALRDELGIPEDAPVVGMVANLDRAVKGGERFLRAVPLILDEVPEARFIVVGGGSEDDAMDAALRSAGIEDRVFFPGYRPDVDVFYDLMDVSVLTSSSEGLSITLLESMSRGLPVVATRVGGNPELVVEGATGYLVPPDDVRAFAKRVASLLRDPALRERLGRAGRKRVRAEFDLENVVEQYRRLYRSQLAVPRGRVKA